MGGGLVLNPTQRVARPMGGWVITSPPQKERDVSLACRRPKCVPKPSLPPRQGGGVSLPEARISRCRGHELTVAEEMQTVNPNTVVWSSKLRFISFRSGHTCNIAGTYGSDHAFVMACSSVAGDWGTPLWL